MSKKIKATPAQVFAAVRKNVSMPDAEEAKEYTISKKLRASSSREGDSEIGITLFIGIADQHGIPEDETLSILAIEMGELTFKRAKYHTLLAINDRFMHKTRLINNYLRLVYGIRI